MTTSADENAALARRFLADVVAADDRSAGDAFLAEDVVIHDPVFGAGASATAYGDVQLDVRELVAGGDRVAVRGTVRGPPRAAPIHQADAEGWFEVAQSWFYRVDRGRITELWRLPDGLGLLRQLGAHPSPTIGRDGHDTETNSDL